MTKVKTKSVSKLKKELESVTKKAQSASATAKSQGKDTSQIDAGIAKSQSMVSQTKKQGSKSYAGSSSENEYLKSDAYKKSIGGTPMITSSMGKSEVMKADSTMSNLAPISAQTTTPVSEGATQTGAPTTQTTTPDNANDYITYVHPTTGQEMTLKGNAITEEAKADAVKKGYAEATSEISGVKTTPEMAKVKRELDSATRETDSFMTRLESMLVSDKELAGEVKQISAKYKARQNEMREINERRQVAMETLGVRTGARYTGGSGGIMGGLLSEEERQGLMRIETIENDKQDAIMQAKKAARDTNFTLYTTLAAKAEKLQEKKANELQALKVAQAEQDKKIAEEKQQAEYDALIMEQLSTGETDPLKIVQALSGKVPFDQIKEITELMPKKEFQFISGTENQASGVFDKSTGMFTRTGGGGGTGGGNLGGIVPVGTPSVSGIGTSYKNSSFEAQMVMDDIMNKIPVQLRNTENEVALKYEQIRKQLAAGYTYQQIVDRLSGFSLQEGADKTLGSALYDASLGTEIDTGKLASMLNRGANEQAMTTVENAQLQDASGFFSKTDKARATIKQADVVLDILNDPTFPKEALGAFDGRKFKVEKFFGISDTDRAKVQKLETALQLLASPIRVEVAGTAATDSEMAKISAFQSDILDQPDTIQVQVEGLRDSVTGFHNQARSQRGLPEASREQIVDNKKRLDLYRSATNATQGKIEAEKDNRSLFNSGEWANKSVPTDPLDVFTTIGL